MLSFSLPTDFPSQTWPALYIEEEVEVLTGLKPNCPVDFSIMMSMFYKPLLSNVVVTDLVG